MRKVFQEELADVQQRLVGLSDEVLVAITKAVEAFNTSNLHLAEEVIGGDERIDDAAVDLDELSITILAKQQPVAKDLRTVVSALRMSASIERMGDLAGHIAQLARYRFPESAVPGELRAGFQRMGELVIDIARKVPILLQTEDDSVAREITAQDDEIDTLHQAVFDTVLAPSWKGSPADTVDVTLASRYHERFADHAVLIAQKVVYLETGDWKDSSIS
ncbi:MAG: phosphate signaling complex protein PhoU [Microbacteriaceae bacterium]|nr:phosphate signaling complex protein PhoU [Microbacteriaceae bacterium]